MIVEKSKSQIPPDYHLAVYYNGHVEKISSSNSHTPNHEIRFYVKCSYWKPSRGEKPAHFYYLNHLFDSNHQPIKDNRFNWEGVKCKLHIADKWAGGSDTGKWYVELIADVEDITGVEG